MCVRHALHSSIKRGEFLMRCLLFKNKEDWFKEQRCVSAIWDAMSHSTLGMQGFFKDGGRWFGGSECYHMSTYWKWCGKNISNALSFSLSSIQFPQFQLSSHPCLSQTGCWPSKTSWRLCSILYHKHDREDSISFYLSGEASPACASHHWMLL